MTAPERDPALRVRLRRLARAWHTPRVRSVAAQLAVLVTVAGGLWFLASNASLNLGSQNQGFGFDFLSREAGFGIGESILSYEPHDTYAWAFLTGLVNTVTVSLFGLVFATLLGFLIGIGSLAGNRSLRAVCLAYVGLFRNIPLLLQLYLWYAMATSLLPAGASAWHVLGIHISRVGVFFPTLRWQPDTFSILCGLATFAVIGSVAWLRWIRHNFQITTFLWLVLIAAMAGFAAALLTGDTSLETPVWQRFRFQGGIKLSPEFMALCFGLSIYTASFIAEIVRAGILAIPKGQKEAAQSIGLTPWQTLRKIVIPQATRLIVPPMTSQCLNLVKNSSLGVAIGYPDLVSISNTALNLTGRAIECITIMMAVYLFSSLVISVMMNVWNRRMAIRER